MKKKNIEQLTKQKQRYYIPSQTLQLAEWHVYGSSRLGIYKANKPLVKIIDETITTISYQTRVKFCYNGKKQYELTNHLSNVLVTISDRRKAICNNQDSTLSYRAIVVTATDYYSFGSPMVGRTYEGDTANKYRFGINTQEKDDEIYGKGNATTAEFWEYDTRLGRRWNLDPKPQIYLSDYSCFGNNPIWFIDPLGDNKYKVDKDGNITLIRKNNRKYDKLVSEGNIFKRNSIKVDKGILDKKTGGEVTVSTPDGNKDIHYDAYHGLSNSQGEKLFKFLANNTRVEWTLFELGVGNLSKSSISTSHNTNNEVGSLGLLKDNIFLLSLTRMSHVHPSGSKTPSGSWAALDEPQFRDGDVGFAKWAEDNIIALEKNANSLNSISNRPTQTFNRPVFRIYTVKDNSYTIYDKNTYVDPGIIITPKK